MKTRLMIVLAIISFLLTTGAYSSNQGIAGLENKTWNLKSYGEEGSLQDVLGGTEITLTLVYYNRTTLPTVI